jgi:hypothetical protein
MPRGLLLLPLILLVACQPSPSLPTPGPAPTVPLASGSPKPTTPPTPPSPAASPAATGSPSPRPTTPPSPVAGTPIPVTATRLDLLNTANESFASGDATAAAQLYERVLNTPPPPGEPAATTAAINDFAHFRAIVAWLSAGQDEDALDHLDALLARDANAPLGRLAQQLWDQFSMTADVRAACAQLQPEVVSQAGSVIRTLQGLGVSVETATFCGAR